MFEMTIIAEEGDQGVYFYVWVVKRKIVGQFSNKMIIGKCQVLFCAFTCILFH